jgi:hypothetical protein
MTLTRKQFLSSMLGIAAGATLFAACGGDDGGGNTNPDARPAGNCSTGGTAVAIGSNHGHTMTVTAAEVTAGVDKTYDIKGSSDHTHSVTVSAALFTMLKANTAVNTTSTNGDGHTHTIGITCA